MLVFGVVGAAGVARAADSAEAEALIRKGIEFRQQGRDAPALPLFQKAYDLVATPRTAGQLGCGEMALGYWLDAEQHLDESLAAPEDPWVAKNLEVLTSALVRVRSNLGEVAVSGAPLGAKVTINRHSAGALPLAHPVHVAKGKVEIEVSAPGFVSATQTLQVNGGERVHFAADLVRTAPLVVAQEARPASPLPPLTPLRRDGDPDAAGSGASSGGVGRKVGWGLGALAAVALAGSVVETVVWQSKRSKFNGTTGCYEDQPGRGGSGCSALFDAAHRAEVFSIIGYASAGLLVGSAALLLLTSHPAEPRGSALACAPGVGGRLPNLSCRFSF